MGYDMSIRDYTGPEKVIKTHINGTRSEEPNYPGDYFRLNIWGMGVMRDVMFAAGALDVSGDDGWPDPPQGEGHFDDEYEPLTEEAKEFREREIQYRMMSGKDGKVPVRKFGSNDGWIVIPEECLALANKLAGFVADDDRTWHTVLTGGRGIGKEADAKAIEEWRNITRDFVDFCRRAAESGDGFEVF